MLPQDPPEPAKKSTPPPPLLPPTLVEKHSTPKTKKTQTGASMAALMAQFQQSCSHNVAPIKNTQTNITPIKNTPSKVEPMPGKKILTPDHTMELPVKKHQTSSPSSEQESETDHGGDGRSKQKKKKK